MTPARRRSSFLSVVPLLLLAASADAQADELSLAWNGRVQSDLRFRVEDKGIGDYYDRTTLPAGVERNQNLFNLKLKANYGSFTGVASVDFVLNGYTGKLQGIDALNDYTKVQPYRFEPQALYIDAKDLLKGLDLRVGHQIVSWGAGDQFNPTNNLNANDLRDPLLFGRQQANFMVKADYWISEKLSLSAVLVPIFKPALLPTSAALGVADASRLPFTSDTLRHRIEAESGLGATSLIGHPTVVGQVDTYVPDVRPENMQAAFRIAGQLGEQDLALSYYIGRTDFPQPFLNHVSQVKGAQCHPFDPTNCIQGQLQQAVSLGYPRMHVYGFNASGEFNPFKWISDKIHGMGYRAEVALVVPSEATLKVESDELKIAIPQPAGEYDYDGDGKPGGPTPRVVEPTPFVKWTLGLDYAFGEHVYTNVQWVHGLVDEYGAGDFIHQGWAVRHSDITSNPDDTLTKCVVPKDGTRCAREMLRARLGDYLVIGVDLKFLSDAALLRLFTIWDLSGYTEDAWDNKLKQRVQTHYNLFSKEGFSAVLYPEFSYNFGNGLELGAGALVELGRSYTKFGDPAAGGSTVFTRGKFSF
ncbi:MAG: hypothetical protein U0359_38820 [Byssovorax sp.]